MVIEDNYNCKQQQAACKLCGRPLFGFNGKKGPRKNKNAKFCSDRCRTRFNSKKDYYNKRNDPAYKKMKRRMFDKWREKNREHFNEMMRKINRRSQKRTKQKRLAMGLCVYCGKVKPAKGYKCCRPCLDWRSKYSRELRAKKYGR